MTLRQTNLSDSHTTDIAFRAGCQTFHDNFVAAGLVQTADTGQIDLTTVVRAAQSTAAGYEVWRFDDVLQSASPIFFKFEYGSAHAQAYGFWVTTGSGSDGAGNITVSTGTVTPRKALHASVGAPTGGLLPCYFNYRVDGSGFTSMYWPAGVNSAAASQMFTIERFRNFDGTPNADGWNVYFAYGYNTSGAAASDARFSGSAATQPTTQLAAWPVPSFASSATTSQGSTVFGTTLYPIPVFTGAIPRAGGPSQLLLVVGRSDLGPGATVVVPHYGAACTWVAAGQSGTGSGWGQIDLYFKLTSFLMRAD